MAKLTDMGGGAFGFTRTKEAGIEFKKRDIDRLVKQLASTSEQIRKRGVRRAVTAGGKVLQKAIKSATPVDSGTLKRNIGVRNRTYKRSQLFYSIVGAKWLERKQNPAVYMHILETGGKKLSRGRNPFARQAFEQASPAARAKVVSTLRSEVAKIRGKAR